MAGRWLRRSGRAGVTVALVAIACGLGWWMWQHYRYQPWTRDAQIEANVVNVAPNIAGTVAGVAVQENQLVHKGDVLFRIDPRQYQHALAEAKATMKSNHQAMRLAESKAERRRHLAKTNTISPEKLQQSMTMAEQARADYRKAQAQYEQAKLDVEWTTVHAPVNGYVTHLLLSTGDYINSGENAVTLIDSHSFHVTAYFQETKLPRIRIGDPVKIELMAGGTHLHGHVGSISRGIAASNNRSGERHLARVNTVFEWVRLARRIPVRIELDEVPDKVRLSVGMTATVAVQRKKPARDGQAAHQPP